MTFLFLPFLSFALAAPSPSIPVVDWNHVDFDKLRSDATDVCRKEIHARHDIVGVIQMEQLFGVEAASQLLTTANETLPAAESAFVAKLIAANGSDNDVRAIASSFQTAESIYLSAASDLGRESSALEFDKTLYADETRAKPKERERLVADCAERVVAGFRFGATAVRIHREQIAFLTERCDEASARLHLPPPETPVPEPLPPADPSADAPAPPPLRPARVGPSP